MIEELWACLRSVQLTIDLNNHQKSGVESVNRGGGSEREGGKGEKST